MIREAFDIKEHEQIIAMIYMGTPSVTPRPAPTVSSQDFIKHWH
jgi:hypothetical protein